MNAQRSGCPIKLTVETLGDRWSLIVIRDLMFGNRRHFRELLTRSEERITSNILADRLTRLEKAGLVSRRDDPWLSLLARGRNVRQSVTLPARVARRVKSLAKTSRTSANRIIVELIESGIEARQQEKKRFIELADRLARSRDVEEQTRLKEELAVMTFGE